MRILTGPTFIAILFSAIPLLSAQQSSCPPPDSTRGLGAVVGRVVDAQTQVPMGFARIRIRAQTLNAPLETRASPSGYFQFCDVAAGDLTISGQLAQLGAYLGARSLQAGETLELILELSAADTGRSTGTLAGIVLDRTTGDSIDGATVTLPNLGQTAITNLNGRFTFPSLPPGRALIMVGRLGYAEATGEVEILTERVVQTQVSLALEPITLDPIEVTAVRRRLDLPGLDDFERRFNSRWGDPERGVLESQRTPPFLDLGGGRRSWAWRNRRWSQRKGLVS